MRKHLTIIYCLFFTLILTILGGCMVGPDYSRPETAADTNEGFFYAGKHNQDVNDFAAADRWWERFGDSITSQLVREALKNNYDLKAAAARVLQAEAALKETRGRKLPEVSYNLGRDRSKMSFNLGGGFGAGRFSVMSTTWSQNISVAYMLDFFGKLKRAERAAWADMFATKANEQALINSIIAGVINARIDIAGLQNSLDIAKDNTKSLQKTLEIVERRYEQGLVGPVDIRLARENLAASKAAEPVIEMSLIQACHALDILLARRPGSSEDMPGKLRGLPELGPVPVSVPASLLDRRPDVMAAELALRSANEMIGVSIGQLYPDLTISAAYGSSADRWRDIWEHFAETYSLTTSLAQPIFRGGQIRAQINAAKARYAELAAVYNGTVLTAMAEVEDALASERMLLIQLEHAHVRFKEAKAAEDLSRQRYQRGIDGILVVLESERRRRIAEDELTGLMSQIWTTRVNLHLALGGDWDYQKEEKVVVKEDGKK